MKLNVRWSPCSRLPPSVSVTVRIQTIVTEERALVTPWPQIQTADKDHGRSFARWYVNSICVSRQGCNVETLLILTLINRIGCRIGCKNVLTVCGGQHSGGTKVRLWLLHTAGAANWHFDSRGHGGGAAAAPALGKKWNYQIKWDPISNVVEWTQYLGQFYISRI